MNKSRQNKFNRSELKTDEFILIFPNENQLEMYSILKDGNVLITVFLKKAWGTWNIGGWLLVEEGKDISLENSTRLAAGSTDWEYVFRVKRDTDTDYIFSGGNHGNEVLKSIQFIDADSDSEVKIEVGHMTKIKKLNIVEYTSLLIPQEGSVYAKVKRNYVIEPSKISLDTGFEFTSDIFMGTSYVCMFPVSKEYGRYINLGDNNEHYETPKYGETLTKEDFENFYGMKKALSATIWGGINPNYKFKVSIKNPEMVDNFQNKLKTFYWDLNESTNKLYFSKYDSEDDKKIDAGTIWHNSAEWEFEF
ncbi:MAG: hypothetical protein A2Y24_04135 [Clostridiales bacterium GWE2_32_10]|nr:MAG: hypothetical protein A2Y24_04135 [Clostridiales bacterium GWE2_32_10]HBY21692.1 hypothetical protein [Clostridiales bacterium]